MKTLFGIARNEFRMSITRRGLLIVTLLLIIWPVVAGGPIDTGQAFDAQWIAANAGLLAFAMNIFIPVVSGILAADRAVRDNTLHMRELLRSTPLNNASYVAGKYIGVAASLLAMQAVIVFAVALTRILQFDLPLDLLWASLSASVVLNVPAILFVTAFSLLCPLVMPVRVYQILFTGYWYWGNFLSPDLFPSISRTLLNASGQFALSAFYTDLMRLGASQSQALLNIAIILLCALGALGLMWLLLEHRENAK